MLILPRSTIKVQVLASLWILIIFLSCSKAQVNSLCLVDAVYVEEAFGKIFLPNVFTPNGDGDNDVYRIGNNLVLDYKLDSFQIFDSSFNMIVNVNQILQTDGILWDGIFEGEVQYGKYTYRLYFSNGSNQEFLGSTIYSVRCLEELTEYPYVENCQLPDHLDNWQLNHFEVKNLKCWD